MKERHSELQAKNTHSGKYKELHKKKASRAAIIERTGYIQKVGRLSAGGAGVVCLGGEGGSAEMEVKDGKGALCSTSSTNLAQLKRTHACSKSRDSLNLMNPKKQKIDEHVEAKKNDDQEEAEMKRHIEIVKDDESYGSSKRYSSMIKMLQDIDREDLETLWKLVKAKHENKRPEEDYEKVLWGDLKVMFKPDIKSEVWKNLQGYKVTVWKLFDNCGVHFVRLTTADEYNWLEEYADRDDNSRLIGEQKLTNIIIILERVNCVLQISGLYTLRLLDAACKKVQNLLKKGFLKVKATLKSAWTEKDQIDNLLKERRLMRSLEKFVGGKLYEGDL
ncbi:hypothetical protein Tco_0643816 [Tanacetum coccineum]